MKTTPLCVLVIASLLSLLCPTPSSVEATPGITYVFEEVLLQKIDEEVMWGWFPEGWSVSLYFGEYRYHGITHFDVKWIVLWLWPNDTVESVASIYVHELAHAFSYLYLTDDLRAEWLAVRGIPKDTLWLAPSPEESSYNFAGEDFAECVSWMFQKGKFKSRLGPVPNQAQQDLIRKWLITLAH